MSYFDLGFAVVSLVIALLVIVRSPFYRAVLFECLFHPRSDGWVDSEEDGSVYVHRGETLPDYMLEGALDALEDTRQAVEYAERTARPPTVTSESSNRWAYAAAVAAAAVASGTAYLLRRNNGASEEKS